MNKFVRMLNYEIEALDEILGMLKTSKDMQRRDISLKKHVSCNCLEKKFIMSDYKSRHPIKHRDYHPKARAIFSRGFHYCGR